MPKWLYWYQLAFSGVPCTLVRLKFCNGLSLYSHSVRWLVLLPVAVVVYRVCDPVLTNDGSCSKRKSVRFLATGFDKVCCNRKMGFYARCLLPPIRRESQHTCFIGRENGAYSHTVLDEMTVWRHR